jgi:hypothetical protein
MESFKEIKSIHDVKRLYKKGKCLKENLFINILCSNKNYQLLIVSLIRAI